MWKPVNSQSVTVARTSISSYNEHICERLWDSRWRSIITSWYATCAEHIVVVDRRTLVVELSIRRPIVFYSLYPWADVERQGCQFIGMPHVLDKCRTSKIEVVYYRNEQFDADSIVVSHSSHVTGIGLWFLHGSHAWRKAWLVRQERTSWLGQHCHSATPVVADIHRTLLRIPARRQSQTWGFSTCPGDLFSIWTALLIWSVIDRKWKSKKRNATFARYRLWDRPLARY